MNIVRLIRKSISTKTYKVSLDTYLETNRSCSRFYCEAAAAYQKKVSLQSLVEEISKLTRGLYFHSENNADVVRVLRRHNLDDKDIIGHLSRSPKLFLASAANLNKVIGQIKTLGLSLNQAMELLERNPDILNLEHFDNNIQEVIGELKSFGLIQKEVKAMLLKHPQMISAQVADIKLVYKELKGYFTKAEARAILVKCPNLLTDDLEETTARIIYAYDEMGISTNFISKSGILHLPLNDIVARHKFLERMGLYKKADPREHPVSVIEGGNPEYQVIFKLNDKSFAQHVARSTLEEYQIFKELLKYERKHYNKISQDYDEDDDDYDEDDDDHDEDDDDYDEDDEM